MSGPSWVSTFNAKGIRISFFKSLLIVLLFSWKELES